MPLTGRTMRIAFHGSDVHESTLLSPPVLPQAKDGILDLSSPSVTVAGAVEVEIPPYAQFGWGDQVTVVFRGKSENPLVRFAYLPNPAQFQNQTHVAEVRVKPLSALASGSYDVGYSVASRTGNVSNSAVSQVQIINSPYAGGSRAVTVDTSFFGTYMPGAIGGWVVPIDYSLSTDSDIAVRSLSVFGPPGPMTAGVQLKVYRTPPVGDKQLIALVESSDGEQWKVSPVGDSNVSLHQKDLISIELDGKSNARFFVTLTL